MGTLDADIAWPPSVNRYYRHVGPKVLISREGRRYREGLCARLRGRVQTMHGAIRMTAEFFPPDRRRRDLDNLLKCTPDSLMAAGAFKDDSQISEMHLYRGAPCPPDGYAHIRLEEI